MAEYKFGFIGVGNMGSALVRAAVKNLNPSSIVISTEAMRKPINWLLRLNAAGEKINMWP